MRIAQIFQVPCEVCCKLLLIFVWFNVYNSPIIPPFPSSSGDENNSVHIKLEKERDGALVSHMCH